MNKLLDIGRFIFISFEMVIALLVIVIYVYWPFTFQPIGALIISNDLKVIFTAIGLPLIGLSFWYLLTNELTTPKDMSRDLKEKFYKWDGYPRLRNRILFSLSLCVISLVIHISLWLLSKKSETESIGFIYTLFNAIWFVSIFSMAIATQYLKPILGGQR